LIYIPLTNINLGEEDWGYDKLKRQYVKYALEAMRDQNTSIKV
jgi:hypothetical protein